MVLLWQRFNLPMGEFKNWMTDYKEDSFSYWLSVSQRMIPLYSGRQSIIEMIVFSFIRMYKTAPTIKEREEAARVINRCLSISMSNEDLSSDSYYIASLLFTVYRDLDQLSLIGNALKVLNSRSLPPMEGIPIRIQMIWNRRIGMFKVDNGEYVEAFSCFKNQSFSNTSIRHLYIPLRILCLGELPSLKKDDSFYDVVKMIKYGSIGPYNRWLEEEKKELLEKSSYSIWEKLIPLVWRSFIRRFYLFCDCNSRLSITRIEEEVGRLYGADCSISSVIPWLCRLVELKLMMGYCNWTHKMVVLRKGDSSPFPYPLPLCNNK